jgi:perosamine synthetase
MINQMEPGYGEVEKQAIQSYLDSGGWLTEFTNTREFEARVGEYVGAEYAHTASNGTIGLVVALMALDIGDGDEVIVPNFTHVATAYAVDLVGAKPVMVDVDRDTLCLDPGKLDSAISEETAAIIHVSLNGRSHGIDRVQDIARRHDLALVEDAAQSLGSRHNGSHLGTIGDIGVFSFSYAKIITTGQGGMIVTDDADISKQVEMVRDFGRPESGVDDYDILGLNAKFTDLQAVIGLAQMDRLTERVEFKKDLYRQYRSRYLCHSISQDRP